MAIDEAALRRRARRAYNHGRARASLLSMSAAVPPTLLSAQVVCDLPTLLTLGTVLAVGLGAATWVGGAWRRGIWPGLWAGALGGGALLGVMLCGVCAGENAWLCHLLCPAAGVLAGGMVGLRSAREPQDRGRFLISAALTAGLTGSLGCVLVGLSGVIGLAIGVALAAAPAAFLAEARGRA